MTSKTRQNSKLLSFVFIAKIIKEPNNLSYDLWKLSRLKRHLSIIGQGGDTPCYSTIKNGFGTRFARASMGLLYHHTTLSPQRKLHIEQPWSSTLGIGTTKKPIVAMIENNIFAAVRLGGMVVATGSLVGEEVAELVLGDW